MADSCKNQTLYWHASDWSGVSKCLHRLILGFASECHNSLKLVMISLPLSPPFPFVSSMLSRRSITFSPVVRCISLGKTNLISHVSDPKLDKQLTRKANRNGPLYLPTYTPFFTQCTQTRLLLIYIQQHGNGIDFPGHFIILIRKTYQRSIFVN